MAICLRRLIPLATITMLVAGVLMLVGPAGATVPGANGLILWARFNPDLGDDDIYIANPDGTNEHRVWGPSECPRWSPDGDRILLPGITIINWDGSNPVFFSSATTQNFGVGFPARTCTEPQEFGGSIHRKRGWHQCTADHSLGTAGRRLCSALVT